ncbi:phosphodiesterase [Wenzhouxiangella sp. XN201]|uniref:alkaline phosphatase family protein n=1 Tax=Wenzhouxiangella sp. XN201 TaxID=2710755 RepID=UPI0013C7A125|nr:alkaline phosphatase family protein [Wenzhouxiangella sp. XN201]NEZ04124.1 phosphodiesterase [Wenzhouxiangella sp. XN201]
MAFTHELRCHPALIGALLGTLVLVGCGGDPEPVDSRVVVLGFDGMDPVLAQRWMEAGKLPNFSRLAADGHFQELGTSNPPQSPVAWSSFATGQGPGEHGIYDFLRRNPETYTPDFSISENIPPDRFIKLFGLQVPLGSGEVINRRKGEPFWLKAERDEGARASVLRIPVTYPPDDIHRMLSGMGVPDLLGTQGTYTFYTTTRLGDAGSSTRTVRVRPDRQGRIESDFEGPPDPLLESAEPMTVPLVMTPGEEGARVRLGDDEVTLAEGEWSDWIRVEFHVTGPVSVSGTVRLLLVQGYPQPRLYVSPIQIDPENPAVEIASPSGYAADLVEDIGLFHTIGMPEETWSLNEEHISDAAWLEMEKTILAEREAMWYETLDKHDSDLVVGAFVQTDRVTHMFYRGLDEQHPRHTDTDPAHRDAVEWIYREADRILGETLDRLGPDDRLIVISDHGFAPFRKAVHLNRWLVDNGYLVLEDGASESDVIFSSVDWSQSRAYALGLNGLFLNRAGREGQGIVTDDDTDDLLVEIAAGLQDWSDPDTGEGVVRRVFDGAEVYPGGERDDAPDLVVGYERGYRASWQTTLGAIPKPLMEPNRQKWSGDHCIDPALVPGVLFANFRPEVEVGSIQGVWQLTRRQIREDEG